MRFELGILHKIMKMLAVRDFAVEKNVQSENFVHAFFDNRSALIVTFQYQDSKEHKAA
jgi:hypothetical protein